MAGWLDVGPHTALSTTGALSLIAFFSLLHALSGLLVSSAPCPPPPLHPPPAHLAPCLPHGRLTSSAC